MPQSQTKKKQRIRPTLAKLYHRDQLIGIITDIAVMDMFQWAGHIELTPAAEQFAEMFAYYDSEERDPVNKPFDESLIHDWSIEDDNGRRKILWPIIRNGNEIYWRD